MVKKRIVIPVNRPKPPTAKSGIRAIIEARRKAMAGKSEPPVEENKVRKIKQNEETDQRLSDIK